VGVQLSAVLPEKQALLIGDRFPSRFYCERWRISGFK
jgi:hypothetical protein